MKNIISLSITVLCCVCCKQTSTETKEVEKKLPEMSAIKTHTIQAKAISNNIEELNSWKEYYNLVTFINRFKNISASEALENAKELKEIIEELKKNSTPKTLSTKAFKARINVLENEILRLYDMSKISAITSKEVHFQIDKISTVFNSVNAKINTIYKEEKLNKEINLDNFFKIDSSKRKQRNKKRLIFIESMQAD